jgi:hypothetical protein
LLIAALAWFCLVAVRTPPREDLPQMLARWPLAAFGAVALALVVSLLPGRLAPVARGLLSALAAALLLSLTLDYGEDLFAASGRFDPRVAVSTPILAVAVLVLLRVAVTIKREVSPAVGAALGAPLLLIVLAWFTFANLSPCLLPTRSPGTEFYPVVLALVWTTIHYGVLLLGTTVAAQERTPSRVLAGVMAVFLVWKMAMMA